MTTLSKDARENLARKRIRNILSVRILASTKQLESKISESGPTDQRCDPHIISTVIRKMNDVTTIEGPGKTSFYVLKSTYFPEFDKADQERTNTVFKLYENYRQLTMNPDLCGHALETVVWNTIRSTDLYFPIGGMGKPVKSFDQIELPGAVDFILSSKTSQFLVLGEAKNLREWIYPSSKELWEFIHKAVVFHQLGVNTVPVLIARKIHYSTRLLFKRIGILGVETHRQLFSPSIADQLIDIRHKDGLGFHDISTDLEPPTWLRNFFEKTIPKEAGSVSAQFKTSLPILEKHAKNMSTTKLRNAGWKAVAEELGHSHDYD